MASKKYDAVMARRDLPTRHRSDNKTRGGKCLIIAGSPGMWGAAVLCAQAAARTGAGYVYLHSARGFPSVKQPDFLVQRKSSDYKSFRAIALGPGYRSPSLRKIITRLEKQKINNVVLDAEALNAIATRRKQLPSTWILTPHEGELARLLGVSSQKIRAQREKYVRQAQKKFGGIILLKGAGTLIENGQNTFVIGTGNPALAKAGSGDVLTGIIAGLLSQGLKPLTAACLGAYLHGLCAERWLKTGHDVLSLLASDLLSQLPFVLRQVRTKKR